MRAIQTSMILALIVGAAAAFYFAAPSIPPYIDIDAPGVYSRGRFKTGPTIEELLSACGESDSIEDGDPRDAVR
jgi:hypothetical protein